MDIKSVIKTFAEAWAAASLKMDNSSINMTPSLIPAWKTSPAPGKICILFFSLINDEYVRMEQVQST